MSYDPEPCEGAPAGAAPLAPTAEEEKLDPIWGWCEHGRSAVECPEPHPMMNIDDLIQRINGALNEPMGRGDERRVRKVLLAALASPPSAPAAAVPSPPAGEDLMMAMRSGYQKATGVSSLTLARKTYRAMADEVLRLLSPQARDPEPEGDD